MGAERGVAGTHKTDAGAAAWHQGAHICGAAEGRHHGHVELLEDSGWWLVCAQPTPSHGQAPYPVTHTLVLLRQPGHLHIGVDGG